MKVDAYASMPHYWDHLAPIVEELDARGVEVDTWALRHDCEWGPALPSRRPVNLTLVASTADAKRVRPAPLIYVEHGAGQSYYGDPAGIQANGWAGTRGLDDVRLFVVPGPGVAAKWSQAYPATPIVQAGPVSLDPYLPGLYARQGAHPSRQCVAVTFHWDCHVVPETRSAFDYYARDLPRIISQLRADGYEVIGHGHPRIYRRLERTWKQLGIEGVPAWADVLDRAQLLIGDNSSALYEFAATARPVLVLNAPWYRRDIEHGMRFWSAVPGLMVDSPDGVYEGVSAALALAGEQDRASAVSQVYAHLDGRAAHRAADAIQEVAMSPAPYSQREVARETTTHGEQLVTRLRQLGATDEEVKAFAEAWDDAEQWEPGERQSLIAASDGTLVAQLHAAREEDDFHMLTEEEEAARDSTVEQDKRASELAQEAYDVINGNVGEVLAWVMNADEDPRARARAVLHWESTAERPRSGVMDPLTDLLDAEA